MQLLRFRGFYLLVLLALLLYIPLILFGDFGTSGDFQGGLLLNGYNGQVEQVFPFTSRMIRDSSYWPNHNILNVIRTKKIDHFSCLSSAKTSPYSCDSIVYYNDDIDSFLASNYFANKIECERSALRSWLSKIFK
jgi:hypothetical protein